MTSAVLSVSSSAPDAEAEDAFAATALEMADASEVAYRRLVERPGFATSFARITPSEEIARLAIGSRPARRTEPAAGLESLRAISWVFAWAQSRLNLPGWYGLGSGLDAIVRERGGLNRLRKMYREWPFFRSLLENAQMSLAKADLPIGELYLALGEDEQLAAEIRAEYARTVELVLAVTEQEALLAPRVVLRRAIELRNPYVDALSFLQARFLAELRESAGDPEREEQMRRLVHLTINGIAAGLQNTG